MNLTELLERFRRGPELLAGAMEGAAAGEVDYLPAPGKWTIRQILAHLADAETVGAFRFRAVIAEDNPALSAFDQDAWTTRLDYQRREPAQSLDTFRCMRSGNHAVLKEVPESAYSRAGNHTENGPMTLAQLLEGYTMHAERHANQIQAIRAEYKKSEGKSQHAE